MSRSLNQVILIGNLTRDPETRALPSGDEFCRFSLALNYSYNTPDGETKDGVDYVDVTAWGGLGSIVQTYCHKGKQVMVQGRLRSSSWEQDGQTRSKLEVRASNILLLGRQSSGEDIDYDRQSVASKKPSKASKAGSKASLDAGEDYELESFDYNEKGADPGDIPF